MDKTMKVQILLPFLLFIVSLIAIKTVKFKLVLTPGEERVSGFIQEPEVLYERKYAEVNSLRSPIEIKKPQPKDFPQIPLSKIVPQAAKPVELKVTMIVISEGRKIAVVNGGVIREGDTVNTMKAERIEKDRILFMDPHSKNTRWVAMEVK